jgi:hypothetical protein
MAVAEKQMDLLALKAPVVPNLDSVGRRKSTVCLHLAVNKNTHWASVVKDHLRVQNYLLMELVVESTAIPVELVPVVPRVGTVVVR